MALISNTKSIKLCLILLLALSVVSAQVMPDSDNDGMPDWWESRWGLNPQLNDAGSDLDNDRLSNLREFQLDTNPTSADTDGDGFSDGMEIFYSWIS